MKISNLFEWFSDNFGSIVGTVVVGGVMIGVIVLLANVSMFPVGTDVTVKNTNIHGTVTKVEGDNVEISCVSVDGTVKTMKYNVHLLQVGR